MGERRPGSKCSRASSLLLLCAQSPRTVRGAARTERPRSLMYRLCSGRSRRSRPSSRRRRKAAAQISWSRTSGTCGACRGCRPSPARQTQPRTSGICIRRWAQALLLSLVSVSEPTWVLSILRIDSTDIGCASPRFGFALSGAPEQPPPRDARVLSLELQEFPFVGEEALDLLVRVGPEQHTGPTAGRVVMRPVLQELAL